MFSNCCWKGQYNNSQTIFKQLDFAALMPYWYGLMSNIKDLWCKIWSNFITQESSFDAFNKLHKQLDFAVFNVKTEA